MNIRVLKLPCVVKSVSRFGEHESKELWSRPSITQIEMKVFPIFNLHTCHFTAVKRVAKKTCGALNYSNKISIFRA